MQVLEQLCTQKHSSNAQIYSRKVWEVKLINNEEFEFFYRGKKSN